MKQSDLRKLIKEEITSVLKEEGDEHWPIFDEITQVYKLLEDGDKNEFKDDLLKFIKYKLI